MESLDHRQAQVSVLLAEDDRMTREALSILITRKFPHAQLEVAKDGQAGLEAFEQRWHDIVITDVSMPVMDGIQMASNIKALKPDAIIILLTAHSDTQYQVKAQELGIHRYLTKPVDFKVLVAEIEKCIAAITLPSAV
jgi:YesN/AraC family two-component response regulator